MSRGPHTFKQSDLVRAVKALQAAGLHIARTEIHSDGRIVIVHEKGESSTELEETYEEWKARSSQG